MSMLLMKMCPTPLLSGCRVRTTSSLRNHCIDCTLCNMITRYSVMLLALLSYFPETPLSCGKLLGPIPAIFMFICTYSSMPLST